MLFTITQDQEALRLMGTNPIRIKQWAFGIATAVLGIAGALLIIVAPVEPTLIWPNAARPGENAKIKAQIRRPIGFTETLLIQAQQPRRSILRLRTPERPTSQKTPLRCRSASGHQSLWSGSCHSKIRCHSPISPNPFTAKWRTEPVSRTRSTS